MSFRSNMNGMSTPSCSSSIGPVIKISLIILCTLHIHPKPYFTKESGLYFNNAYITKKQMCIQLIFLLVIHVKKICKSRSILTVKNWHDYPQRKKCSERKKLKSKEWVINFERHNHFIRIQDYINLLIKNKNQCILRKK